MALLALTALPLAAVVTRWPGPLWGIVALLPVMVATPLLSAAFLTGAQPDGRPRGIPVLASTFFALPLALAGGVGLAAGATVLGSMLATWFVPLLFLLGPATPVLLVFLTVAALSLAPGRPQPATVARAPQPNRRPERRPDQWAARVTPVASPAAVMAVGSAERPAGGLAHEAVGDRRTRAVALLTDRFLAGELTEAGYQAQLDHLLRPGAPVVAPRRTDERRDDD
jgi:hypothetical protein